MSENEVILNNAYRMLVEMINATEKRQNEKNDKKLADSLLPKLCIALINIDEEVMVTKTQMIKHLKEAKTIFVHLCHIRARNPEIITNIFNVRLEQLMKAMARREADILDAVIEDNPDANLIDIEDMFKKRKCIKQLKCKLASDICLESIKEALLRKKSMVYISKTGKRYHTQECPYCKGRELIEKTKCEAEKIHLTPCKCIAEAAAKEQVDNNTVTAFIDESIHSVRWNEQGINGKVGSFSYILCRGKLQSEREISDVNTITKQVDYIHETTNVERITESAIGKVMLTLAFDNDFHGNLNIYVDNMVAYNCWHNNPVNSKLTALFQNVTVTHVRREWNTLADKLGKDMVFLCIPKETYRSIVDKCG